MAFLVFILILTGIPMAILSVPVMKKLKETDFALLRDTQNTQHHHGA